MDISVERDWIPTSITTEKPLTLANTRMRQIDLATELGGPFIAGGLLLLPITINAALLIIVAFNFITFFPQYWLLRKTYLMVSVLQNKVPPVLKEEDKSKSCLLGPWNPIYNIISGGSLFVKQKIYLVVISFALLWLTVLSPHDIIFTSYLNSIGYSGIQLGFFRGLGALLGVGSTFIFPRFSGKFGLQYTSLFYILEEAIMILIAGIIYSTSYVNEGYTAGIFFLIFILLSRIGLYGFELGEIQILQIGVDERIRGEISSIEQSLTSLASLAIFVAGSIAEDPKYFAWLIWGSIFCVGTGAIIFLIWNYIYILRTSQNRENSGIPNQINATIQKRYPGGDDLNL